MKVCAIIVTYNRKLLLLRCVRYCLKQNEDLDILIFDNHSDDGTEDFLKESGILSDKKVQYYYADKNLGGAGGFSNGLRMAYEQGYDYVWMMDDDGYPRKEDCLQKSLELCNELGRAQVIVNALVTSENGSTLSFSTGGFKTRDELISQFGYKMMPDKISPFNGTLISKEVIKKIGYPRQDFFIKGDETEYTYRAKSKGIKLITSVMSDFYHPIMPNKKIKVLFFNISNGEESYWKEYYKARNYVYIYKTYFSMWMLFKHIIHCCLKSLLYQEDKKRKRKYTMQGLRDGIKDRYYTISID